MENRLQLNSSSIPISPDPRPSGTSILNPPENLYNLRSRMLFFLSFSALLTGVVWFGVCVSLYMVGAEYHVMNVMYESRWIPCTIIFAGLSAAILGVWKRETFYIVCAVSAVYSCAGCIVVIVVYSLDFRKALYQMHPPITNRMAGYPRRKYLQLCGCMVIVSSLGTSISALLLSKLWRIASWYYAKITLNSSHRGYLLLSALSQLPLICFSIYVTSHVISLPFSYVHQYMIQELLCALTLITIVSIQSLHYFYGNRLTLKLLLILNACQTVQEVFYTWNSYYISLYIHTSKAKLAMGAETDQYLMSFNFVGHFVRMCTAAYTTYNLSIWLKAPFMNVYCRVELDRRVRQALIILAAFALLLSAGHVIMDVLYTVTAHIYRTLIAFTGISVFYLSLTGISLALFVRSGHILLLIIASVILLLLSAVSVHALYIYMDISYHNVILTHLETMGRDKRQSSYMHFTEAILAFLALLICLIGGAFIFRLLHIDSVHDRRDGKLKRPLLILFALGIVQLELAAANAALIMSIRDDSNVFQSMLAYGVLDSISMFILCLIQIYVCRPANNHVSYGLMILLSYVTSETLTTYNYLSTKTAYVQLLIVFNQMFVGNPSAQKTLMTLFPANEVGLMVAAHIVQLVQWILAIISLVLTALTLEILYEQRKELAGTPGTITSRNALPAVSYNVTKRDAERKMEKTEKKMETGKEECKNGVMMEKVTYDNPVYTEEGKGEGEGGQKENELECGELLPQEGEGEKKSEDKEEDKGKVINGKE